MKTVKIVYRNWKGVVAERSIIPFSISFSKSEWHPQEQWLLFAFDCDKRDNRNFAMKDILEWKVPE